MRTRQTYVVLSFRTTLEAMEWERQCLSADIPGRLIPLPREISAGCGLAWSAPPDARAAVEQAVAALNAAVDGYYELLLT